MCYPAAVGFLAQLTFTCYLAAVGFLAQLTFMCYLVVGGSLEGTREGAAGPVVVARQRQPAGDVEESRNPAPGAHPQPAEADPGHGRQTDTQTHQDDYTQSWHS